MRIILGIIVGFVAWSILWVGSDALFSVSSADWGRKSLEFRMAAERQIPYAIENSVLIVLLIKSFIISIISGFLAALIAKENSKSVTGLGILLLIFRGFYSDGLLELYAALVSRYVSFNADSDDDCGRKITKSLVFQF